MLNPLHAGLTKHNAAEDARLPASGGHPILAIPMSGKAIIAISMPRSASPPIDKFPGPQSDAADHRCAWKGCTERGTFPAPKDRHLTERYMFCLDHVRAYNAQWDFHRGLTTAELEVELRGTSTWDRPTWKLGTLGGGRRRTWTGKFRVNDPLDLGADTDFEAGREERKRHRPPVQGNSEEARALKLMGLAMPLTLDALRRRYKALVKKHHPDANGGSAEAETRMKHINAAYQTLRASLVAA